MAIAKVILNGVTQIDVTQKTVTAASMLKDVTALKNDGTDITGAIESKSSSDLTVSGATVTVPAGYYASNASKSVVSGSAKTPATSITANPSISVNSSTGLITATTSASKSVTPTVTAGYVSSGTAGTVSVSGSKTSQLSTQAATTVTPTEAEQTAVAAGKYTTGAVKIAAIPSDYVGSDIQQNDSTDLTVSGATITVPAGYYAENATKSIASGSAKTPATSITANPSISVNSTTGLITATASASKSVTPTVAAGYVSSGTAGTVSVSGSNTLQLSTQEAATITPTESEQTAVEAGKYTLGEVKVGAVASDYVGSGITRKAAATYNISSSNQTIASGTYLTGAQTIRGVTTLNIAVANIKDGVNVRVGDSANTGRIINVTGTFTDSSTVSTGQTAASAGDILVGYSAWVDGAEVQGSLRAMTTSEILAAVNAGWAS